MAAVSETHKIPSIYGATASSLKEKEPGETTRLLEMSADKKVAVTDTGLCSFWALTWLAAWYIFSGNRAVTSHSLKLESILFRLKAQNYLIW